MTMTYTQAIDYLFSRLPMFSRTGAAAIKADLVNTKKICRRLGDPQNKYKTIHIAGTNGKGSCSHMLAAALQSCGYKTGLYTSPHLKDFRERIRINGEMVREGFVASFTEKMKPLVEEINPSFFELTVGMAFEYFGEEKVDVAVVETGLGGRLDSTNIIVPEISVITNIGMDHMNILGDTPELIAAEKAGIIKKNVPVVVGESNDLTDEVFVGVAAERNAQLVFADKKFYAADWQHENGYLVTDVVNAHDQSRITYQLDLPGYYQLKNLVTVHETLHQLRLQDFDLPFDKVVNALKQVKKLTGLHGRWESINRKPEIILDVAHNEDGVRQLMKQVELSDYRRLHIVFGMVKDKEIDKVLDLLPKEASYYFTRAHIPRALPEDVLHVKATTAGLNGDKFSDVNAALKAAMAKASEEDLILVCGSVFIVGEVISPTHI
jgi:dihydrofolate synthase/folylpolyglutamate synthase